MEDYRNRVVEERDELSEKLEKLKTFMGLNIFGALSSEEKRRLRRQYHIMLLYRMVLDERIENF